VTKQKHILFISSWYPSLNDPTLGIFNRYFAIAASLYNQVNVLHVASKSDLSSDVEIIESQVASIPHVFVNYKKVSTPVPFLSQFIKRKRVISAFDAGFDKIVSRYGKPDLIHLNVVLPMGLGVQYLSAKHKIPYVVNENWSGYCAEDGNYKGFLQKYFTKKIIKCASVIMPTSTYLRDAMQSHGLEGDYQVVPNVVNTQLFRPLQIEKKLGTQLIHISSLNDREKNVSGLIRAFAKASQTENNLRLQIVGEGTDKASYQTLVKELQIEDKVNFLGRLFGEDLVQEINAADALIMFSHFETFCLVIIEAFACGKPVITSSAGAIKTYMRPELGIMTKPKNELQLTNAILYFVKNKDSFSSDFIRAYAVDNYSYEKVGKDLDLIYQKAIDTNA